MKFKDWLKGFKKPKLTEDQLRDEVLSKSRQVDAMLKATEALREDMLSQSDMLGEALGILIKLDELLTEALAKKDWALVDKAQHLNYRLRVRIERFKDQ